MELYVGRNGFDGCKVGSESCSQPVTDWETLEKLL